MHKLINLTPDAPPRGIAGTTRPVVTISTDDFFRFIDNYDENYNLARLNIDGHIGKLKEIYTGYPGKGFCLKSEDGGVVCFVKHQKVLDSQRRSYEATEAQKVGQANI